MEDLKCIDINLDYEESSVLYWAIITAMRCTEASLYNGGYGRSDKSKEYFEKEMNNLKYIKKCWERACIDKKTFFMKLEIKTPKMVDKNGRL